VTTEVPLFPSADAEIVAWPAETPVTRPVWVTVAIAWFELAQTNDEVGGLLFAVS